MKRIDHNSILIKMFLLALIFWLNVAGIATQDAFAGTLINKLNANAHFHITLLKPIGPVYNKGVGKITVLGSGNKQGISFSVSGEGTVYIAIQPDEMGGYSPDLVSVPPAIAAEAIIVSTRGDVMVGYVMGILKEIIITKTGTDIEGNKYVNGTARVTVVYDRDNALR